MAEDDPRDIQSLAVTVGDVVAAYEARRRSARRPVLRVTPPFSGRMRARLHDPRSAAQSVDGDDCDSAVDDCDSAVDDCDSAADVANDRDSETDDCDSETGALHVPPARFVAEDEVPRYPTPDETEDALRADPDVEFSVERHRERHVAAVESWRAAVGEAVASSLELRLGEETHRVEVKTLGDSSA